MQSLKNPRRNQRIRITHNERGYTCGRVYTVVRVDPSDNTLVAKDGDGNEGPWVKWEHCASATPEVGWDWLKSQLPTEALELLMAFEGLDALRLRDELRDHIVLQLPNLQERIIGAQLALDAQVSADPGQEPEKCPFAEMEDPFDLQKVP